jgi:ATP-dependent DNA helicase RecG
VHDTIKNIHFPENYDLQKAALKRIFFDRLLRVQLHSLIQKEEYEKTSLKKFDESDPRREIIKNFIDKLPFTLTNAQKKVIKNCIESIHNTKPMMALLQ